MKKELKLSLIVLVAIFLVSYMTFPWWARPLVLSQVPAEIPITQLELGYPGLSGVTVRNLKIVSDEYIVEIDKAEVNYLATDVVINKIRFAQVDVSDDKPLESLVLPRLSPISIARQVPLQRFFVSELELISKSAQVEFNQLLITRPREEIISIELERINLSEEESMDSLVAKIRLEESLAHIRVNQAKQKLFDSTYQVNSKTVRIAFGLFPHSLISEKLNNLIDLSTPVQVVVSQQVKPSNVDSNAAPITLSINSNVSINSVNSTPIQLTVLGDVISGQDSLTFKGDTSIQASQLNPFENWSIRKASTNVRTDIQLFPEFMLEELLIESRLVNLSISQNEHQLDSDSITFKSSLTNISERQLKTFEFPVTVSLLPSNVKIAKADQADDEFEFQSSVAGEIQMSNFTDQLFNANIRLADIYSSQWLPSVDTVANLNVTNFSLTDQSGSAQLQIRDQNGSLALFDYQDIQLQADAQIGHGRVEGTGTVALNQQPKAAFSFDWVNAENKGSFVLDKSEFQIQSAEQISSQLLEEIVDEVSLIDGKLNYSVIGSVGSHIEVNGQFGLSDMVLSLDENQFEGFALQGQVKNKITNNQSSLVLSSKIDGEKIAFASGMNLSELSLNFDFDQSVGMTITDLSAQLFEGKISSRQLKLIGNELEPSTLTVAGMSLTELIFFLELEALFAEGNIDLTLPLQSVDGKLVVKDGQFKSKKPGIIKYDSGIDLKDSENIALKALQNFHYTQLDGAINYDENGNYLLKIHLAGANPELYDGYPVDFTLNINGHLPGVFKSLFLTGSFEQSILETLSSGELEALQSQDN